MEHKIIRRFKLAKTCFGCNDGPSEGIGMRAYETEDGFAVGVATTKSCHQGLPGLVHGGVIGVYLDEVMWHAIEITSPTAMTMTVEMNITYKKPIEVGQRILIVTHTTSAIGRLFEVKGEIILPDGHVAAAGNAKYVVTKNHFVDDEKQRQFIYYEHSDLKRIDF